MLLARDRRTVRVEGVLVKIEVSPLAWIDQGRVEQGIAKAHRGYLQ
jgi:hypothetical protein